MTRAGPFCRGSLTRHSSTASAIATASSLRLTRLTYKLASMRMPRAHMTSSSLTPPMLSLTTLSQKHAHRSPRGNSAPGSSAVTGKTRVLAHMQLAATCLVVTAPTQHIPMRTARHSTSHAATASEKATQSANSEATSTTSRGDITPFGISSGLCPRPYRDLQSQYWSWSHCSASDIHRPCVPASTNTWPTHRYRE